MTRKDHSIKKFAFYLLTWVDQCLISSQMVIELKFGSAMYGVLIFPVD